MTDNEELMTVWCRMWSEDPALAHQLMTDTCVQWSGQTAGLDTVTGPGEQEQFVAAYRAQHVNVFTARALIDAGDRFAYVWDVALPDGTVHTGADVNVLRGDRIDENWTFVSDRYDDRPDPEPQPADAALLAELGRNWLASNGRALHRAPVIDAERSRVAMLWTGPDGGNLVVLAVRDGEIAKTWTFTGTRPFRY